MTRAAAPVFLNDTLPLGDTPQTPQDYVEQLSATTGLPYVLVRNNMAKIRGVMAEMEQVLRGLTRGVNLEVLDRGLSGGLSYFPRAHTLGVVLPSNSPGVHSLWIPAVALKTALVLKPGSAGSPTGSNSSKPALNNISMLLPAAAIPAKPAKVFSSSHLRERSSRFHFSLRPQDLSQR
jgi:hypothetical protein